MKLIVVSMLALLLFSCDTYSESELEEFDKEIVSYLKKEGITCETSPSGLHYKIIEEGDGELIQAKDNVVFKYKGSFLDGKVFEEDEVGVEFNVTQLIAAWKEVMYELREGGKAFLVSPPQLAYGNHELDDIPQNSILIFEIEVIKVK